MSKTNRAIIFIGSLLFLTGILGLITNFLKNSGICVAAIGIIGLALIWVGIHNERYAKSRSDLGALGKQLEHKEAQIRFEAVQALGTLGDRRALNMLVIALKDEDERVQQAAADALTKVGGLNEKQDQTLKEWEQARPERQAKMHPLKGVTVKMDNAICRVMGNGNVIIEKQTTLTWLLACALAIFLIILLPPYLLNSFRNGNWQAKDWIVFVLLGVLCFSLSYSAWTTPSVLIDKGSRILRIKRGLSVLEIPFPRLTYIKTYLPLGALHTISIGISIVLDDNKVIKLGSVSSTSGRDILQRARAIMALIAETTEINVRPSGYAR